jgi:hypothetical protein
VHCAHMFVRHCDTTCGSLCVWLLQKGTPLGERGMFHSNKRSPIVHFQIPQRTVAGLVTARVGPRVRSGMKRKGPKSYTKKTQQRKPDVDIGKREKFEDVQCLKQILHQRSARLSLATRLYDETMELLTLLMSLLCIWGQNHPNT